MYQKDVADHSYDFNVLLCCPCLFVLPSVFRKINVCVAGNFLTIEHVNLRITYLFAKDLVGWPYHICTGFNEFPVSFVLKKLSFSTSYGYLVFERTI